MQAARKHTVGRIRYQITFIPNLRYRATHGGLFSDELHAKIRRGNVPQQRVVYFDGVRSRSEEINVDYGVRSPSFQLRSPRRDTITYCKQFPHFNFCIEHRVRLPTGRPPPHLAPIDETATIAGLRCRKAEYEHERQLLVWYTDEVAVDDPTGAVLRLEGVPGLLLQTEEIAENDTVDAVERLTVAELSSETPPPGIFSVPASYRRFDDIDAVRAEDRRILDAKAAEELLLHPLSADEREMFVGKWLLEGPKDEILVEIIPVGDNEFRFRTTVLTAPDEAAGRISDEQATMKGRVLMVDDPPNYRLYKSAQGGRRLILIGQELFTFTRR